MIIWNKIKQSQNKYSNLILKLKINRHLILIDITYK